MMLSWEATISPSHQNFSCNSLAPSRPISLKSEPPGLLPRRLHHGKPVRRSAMSRYLTLACAASAILFCGTTHAALMHDPHQNLNLAPEWIEVYVDEFSPGGTVPTDWGTRDATIHHYAQHSSSLWIPFGELEGRETFWILRSRPTFWLEGWAPPYPEEELGDRGLTFHTLDVEALAGADYVTIDPSNVPGRFTYIYSGGSRTVDLPVIARAPEPTGLVLGMMSVAALLGWRKR